LSVPTRVREIVMTRLERLSEPARRVVSIASIVGRECDFRLLQHCAGLTDRDAAEVVEELVRRRVFHGVGERLDFTHDRLREVASQALVPAQRTAIHRLIATSMEAVYAGDFERHYAPLAAHCRDGELWDKAVTYLIEAGTRAAERAAHREAAALFEHAATVAKTLGDFPLLTSSTLYIGTARFCLGNLVAAEESFRHVIDALGEAAAGEKLGLHGLPLVFAESGLTALFAEEGRFEEARAHGTTSVGIAAALNHTYTLVCALTHPGTPRTVAGLMT